MAFSAPRLSSQSPCRVLVRIPLATVCAFEREHCCRIPPQVCAFARPHASHYAGRMRSRLFVPIALLSLLAASGCEEAHSCTLIGCRANDYQLVRDWTPGDYEVELSYTRR